MNRCDECAGKLSWVGLWDSLLLAVFKGAVGLVTRSRALTMSAIYSFHDVVSGAAIIVGMAIAVSQKDEEHPYGHGKMEYIVSLFTSLVILTATLFLLADSVKVMLSQGHPVPHWAAFGAALVSLIANETIYRYNICAYRKLNSPAMLAHAKHHRADAVSSAAVLAAVAGAKMGYHFLDALVAIFEAAHLIILSSEIMYESGVELLDRSLDQESVSSIREVVRGIIGHDAVRSVKSRRMGRYLRIDLHVGLPGYMNIHEADKVSGRLRDAVKRKVKYVGDINIIFE